MIIEKLVEIGIIVWNSEKVPSEWTKGCIIKLPKKGSLCDCNNWRGITLLTIARKIVCRVLLMRLRDEIDLKLRENQAGFRTGRSCNEQIFTLRNIIEQSLEYQAPIVINYIDFKKAFDSIHRMSLWNILHKYGIPQKYINIFKALYKDSSCCIKTESGMTEFFLILSGVQQGCILSPFFFLIIIDYVMRKAMNTQEVGIKWSNTDWLTDLDFADDVAILANETAHD